MGIQENSFMKTRHFIPVSYQDMSCMKLDLAQGRLDPLVSYINSEILKDKSILNNHDGLGFFVMDSDNPLTKIPVMTENEARIWLLGNVADDKDQKGKWIWYNKDKGKVEVWDGKSIVGGEPGCDAETNKI